MPIIEPELTDEQKETLKHTGSAYHGDPTPRLQSSSFNMGKVHHVHWLGYVRDPEPTAALRNEGHMVVVHGDAYHIMENETIMRPTWYPLDSPFDVVLVDALRPRDGQLFVINDGSNDVWTVSDGYAQVFIPPRVAEQIIAMGKIRRVEIDPLSVVPDRDEGEVNLSPTDHGTDFSQGREFPRVQLGDTVWIQRRYLDLLVNLGVTSVKIGGPKDPVVAHGVAIVMPMDRGVEVEAASE